MAGQYRGESNDPTVAANYGTAAVPTFNASNTAGSFWTKDGSSTMIYSAAQGTTFSGTGSNSLTWMGWNTSGGVVGWG